MSLILQLLLNITPIITTEVVVGILSKDNNNSNKNNKRIP
jgi:hypothetical protein